MECLYLSWVVWEAGFWLHDLPPCCCTCEYVTLHDKKDFAGIIKVTNQLTLQKGDYAGLAWWTQWDHMSPERQKRKAEE